MTDVNQLAISLIANSMRKPLRNEKLKKMKSAPGLGQREEPANISLLIDAREKYNRPAAAT